ARALEDSGAKAYDDPAAAARGASRVHLCVRDDAAVDAILAAALPGIDRTAPIVDHTTVLPDGVVARAKRLTDSGYAFMHAPVFMGPPQSASATGTMLASGPRALFERLEPKLAKMTGTVRYFGERVDLAAVYKLLGNAMILSVIGGIADVLHIGTEAGLTREQTYELFSFYDVSGQITGRGKRMAAGDYDAAWTLDMALKDARLMQATAHGAGLPVIDAVAHALSAAESRGLGGSDLGALAAR
ncbi:MAG TPA: NAD(P)-binding domain-containing protein, partial [Candidatus Baltobacteraceae bacterium]|nr:NAD(P)-binding domain-containing protein [Candidatus Baltobacteraceae bacterium]